MKNVCDGCRYFATCGEDSRTELCKGKEFFPLTFNDFLAIANYGNEMWKGSFTKDEVTENAEIYYADFLWSKETKTVSETIKSLAKNLADDVREMSDFIQPKVWLMQMESELEVKLLGQD